LSKLNAFDFVVTVALGSTFGSMILNKSIALADGILGFAVLIGGQYIVSWLAVRSDAVKKIIKNEPSLLYYNGQYLMDALNRSRVVKGEIEQSVRNQGYANLENVEAIVIETDGSFSIISKSEKKDEELNIVGIKV
ncbi:MAG: DUF421 domain-containing protein, partial [Methanosarcina sp.]